MNLINFLFMLSTLSILLLMPTKTYSQAMYIPNSEHPDHPGLCYYRDEYSPEESKSPFFLKPGQRRKHPKNCYRVDCSETLGLSVMGCGVGGGNNQCRFIPGDASKPYPRCCPELVC